MVLRRLGASLSALALLSLAACGGGGGTSPAANNSSSPPPAAGSYTAPAQVSLSMAVDGNESEPFPAGRFTPSTAPTLFD